MSRITNKNPLFVPVNDRPLNAMVVAYYYTRDEQQDDGTIAYNINYRLLEGRIITETFSSDAERTTKLNALAEIEAGAKSIDIVDDCDTDDPTAALSAKQGKILSERIDALPKFGFILVNELPEVGQTDKIYLVPLAYPDPQKPNIKEEWVYANGTWEMIGTTELELITATSQQIQDIFTSNEEEEEPIEEPQENGGE